MKLDIIILKQKKYLERHYYSRNIIKRILWKLLGKNTFDNIIYDCADVFYTIEKPELVYKELWEKFYKQLKSSTYPNIGEASTVLLCFIRAKYKVMEKERIKKGD